MIHPAYVLRNAKAEQLLVDAAANIAAALERLNEASVEDNLFKARR